MGSLNVMKIVTMKKNLNGPKMAKYKKYIKHFIFKKMYIIGHIYKKIEK